VLARLAVGRTSVVITGTNGKTTTSHLVAASLSGRGPVAHNAAGSNMPDGAVAALIHPRPRTGLEGKFSMHYCMAAAALDDGLLEEALRPRHRQHRPPALRVHRARRLLRVRQVFCNPCPSCVALAAELGTRGFDRGDRQVRPRTPGGERGSPGGRRSCPPLGTPRRSNRAPDRMQCRGRSSSCTSDNGVRGGAGVAPPVRGREFDSGVREPHPRCRDHAAPPAGRSGWNRIARLILPQGVSPSQSVSQFSALPPCHASGGRTSARFARSGARLSTSTVNPLRISVAVHTPRLHSRRP